MDKVVVRSFFHCRPALRFVQPTLVSLHPMKCQWNFYNCSILSSSVDFQNRTATFRGVRVHLRLAKYNLLQQQAFQLTASILEGQFQKGHACGWLNIIKLQWRALQLTASILEGQFQKGQKSNFFQLQKFHYSISPHVHSFWHRNLMF